MSVSNSVMIAIKEIELNLDKSKPILEIIKDAMKQAKNHWLVTDQEEQFRSAVGATMMVCNDENRRILEDELKGLRIISSMQSGVVVDIEATMAGMNPKKFFGLMKIWKELEKNE